ncbi:MAG: hypothetical protein M3157_04605 [Actinomycetota bacterium]|nr:hypothetical protein [Actinomycetota bacterium]
MAAPKNASPILVELDEVAWNEKVERAETWFGNVLTVQGAFRRLVESTRDKVNEPHVRDYLGEILDKATEHERRAEELFKLIGREVPTARELGGTLVAGAHKTLGKVEGTTGGATDAWQDLRQLLLNLDSMGAFAVAEQLGFALAMPEVSTITFNIENEKMKHHLTMQELLLETAAINILYKQSI